jgi:hypothetical protein
MRAIDPVTIETTDKKQRKLLLSMGSIRRLKRKLGIENLSEIMSRDAEGAGVPILYEALLDKDGLTEDEFADLLPADLNGIIEIVARLMGASFPAQDDRPISAGPTPIQ